MKTSQSNVPIVGLTSLSALGNKSSFILKVLLMSLSVVLTAAELTKQDVPTVAVTVTHHGIKLSAYLCSVSHIRRSLLRG